MRKRTRQRSRLTRRPRRSQRRPRRTDGGLGPKANGATPYDQTMTPTREWDRATQFLSAFAVSGFISERTAQGETVPVRPASVLLVGGPGSGKTELVERFRRCAWISYHNDLTVRSLLPLLRRAQQTLLTHVAAPEFNKWFQRKSFVAENCVGLLSSAMEEGVDQYSVGGENRQYHYARLGLIGGMTPRSMSRRREMLAEMGFLTRAAVFDWGMPEVERTEIIRRMNSGVTTDVEPITLTLPAEGQRAVVSWDVGIGERVAEFVQQRWRDNDLRMFRRCKTLLLARAYLVGHPAVTPAEWAWLRGYDDYWERLITSED